MPETTPKEIRDRRQERNKRFPSYPSIQSATPLQIETQKQAALLKTVTRLPDNPEPIGDLTFLNVRRKAGNSNGKRSTPPKRP